jgi:hypothetical protein
VANRSERRIQDRHWLTRRLTEVSLYKIRVEWFECLSRPMALTTSSTNGSSHSSFPAPMYTGSRIRHPSGTRRWSGPAVILIAQT